MKGISPMIATVLIIAFTIAIGGIISLFMTNLTKTTTGEAEKSAAGTSECGGAYIDIINVTTGTTGANNIFVYNPSRNIIYTLSVYDNMGNTNSGSGVISKIDSGNMKKLVTENIPQPTATKITIVGYCENTAKTQNVSISGTCPKGGSCWPK